MNDRQRTFLQPGRLPPSPETPWSGFGLPSDLLIAARRRLGTFVAFVGVAMLLSLIVVLLAPIEWPEFERSFVIVSSVAQAVLLVGHANFWLMIRSPRFGNSLILDLGLAYEVILVLTIAVGTHWMNATQGVDYDDRVFAVLLVALYPIIVPSPPRRALLSSFAAAAMLPGGVLLLHVFGIPGTGEQYLTSLMLGLIAVSVAVFGSRVIYRMNVDVAHARRLGSYELESKLGEGGMGEVWRARHRLLARPAAIKLIRRERLGDTGEDADVVLRRFEREARATAAMCSAHTIDVYDFGIASDGTFYYVMELLDGLDLHTLVSRFGPIPAARAVCLLRQVCDSLGEAHAEGLIHRDVKPANLYVCRYGRLACLEKDPDRRPESADVLAESLAACGLDGEWTQQDAPNWWRKYFPVPVKSPSSPLDASRTS